MTTATLAVRFYEAPTASPKWIGPELRFKAEQRRTLVDSQAAYDALQKELPPIHFRDLAKNRWRHVRAEYEKTHKPELLEELGRIGPKGERLAEESRTKKWSIRSAARKIAGDRGCAPIYAAIFRQAAEIARERVTNTERSEREANLIVDLPYQPTELLKSLVNLAANFQSQASTYEEPDKLAFIQPPRDVLGELWPAIANSERKAK